MSDARIYTTTQHEFTIDELDKALDEVLTGGGVDNVILYIHGRACGGGGEPKKSLGGAMPALESDYTAKALMFNWQGSSNGCPLGFPEMEARASGKALSHTLQKLAYYKSINAAKLAGVKLTLIAHSMGNLVFDESVAKDNVPLPGDLFDTVILNSSASALAGHAAWLATAAFSPHYYVTVNNGDNVLTAASALGTRLGLRLDNEPLAPNALYVDFTAANVNHAIYLHSGQKGQSMKGFYDSVMNGLPYDFAAHPQAITSTEQRNGTTIYHFSAK